LSAAKREIRQKFEENRTHAGGAALTELIAEAYDAADFIKTQVVQAERNERGNYTMKIEKHHSDDVPPEGWVPPPPQKCS